MADPEDERFPDGPGYTTTYQHDARRLADGTITIFDDGSLKFDEQSYGLVLELDEDEMTATLVREYAHPDKLLARTQANVQVLPNGNVFIGRGSEPLFSESSRDGNLLFSATFPPSFKRKDGSYRDFCFPWSGQPSDRPAAVAQCASKDEVRVYASWNGATEVAY
jgi:arylsulfotransferase ASST